MEALNGNGKSAFKFWGILLIVGLSGLSMSCEHCDVELIKSLEGNYFPMAKGSYWEYVGNFNCYVPDTAQGCYSTFKYFALGDSLAWDDNYQALSNNSGPFKFIKRNNNEYFSYGYYVPEYKFLDTSIPVNGKWVYEDGEPDSVDFYKVEFNILEVNASKKIRGKLYDNVIVVLYKQSWRQRTDVEFEELSRSYHYYAKDIGEIYARYPAVPLGSGADTEIFLIDYFIAH
jgi:hypothetical protein